MIVAPSATSMVLPSISISTILSLSFVAHHSSLITHHSEIVGHHAFLVLDVMDEFVAEVLDETLDRQCRGVAQRADRPPGDVVGDVIQKFEVLEPALAVLDAVDHAVKPPGTFAAGRALAARLLEV